MTKQAHVGAYALEIYRDLIMRTWGQLAGLKTVIRVGKLVVETGAPRTVLYRHELMVHVKYEGRPRHFMLTVKSWDWIDKHEARPRIEAAA